MTDIFRIDDIDDLFLKGNRGEIYDNAVLTLEKILIEKALERTCGNQIIAAEMLGINRNTIRAKIKRLDINVGMFKR